MNLKNIPITFNVSGSKEFLTIVKRALDIIEETAPGFIKDLSNFISFLIWLASFEL